MIRFSLSRLGLGLVILGCGLVTSCSATQSASSTPAGDVKPEHPVVASTWGALNHGGAVRVMGSAFGAHPLSISSGLGPAGWIESNPEGTRFDRLKNAAGWGVGQASPSPAVISTERAHSGQNSVLARIVRADGYWQSVMRYAHPRPVDEFWISFWYWFDPIQTSDTGYTQNKWFRIGDDDVHNSCGEIYALSRWVGDAPGVATANVYCAGAGPDQWDWDQCYQLIYDREAKEELCASCSCGLPGPNLGACKGQGAAENLPTPRQWTRVVIRARPSDLDEANGEFMFSVHKPGQVAEVAVDWSRIMTHSSACDTQPVPSWRYLQLQNYFADSKSGDQSIRADFFYDDIYIQVGTQARVELGDHPVYAECTQLEVQEPTAWTDQEITVRWNRGGLAPGSRAYLFVVDHDGEVGPGYPVTLK